jgi:hypothetical protein
VTKSEDNNKSIKNKMILRKKEYNILKEKVKDGKMFKIKLKNKNNLVKLHLNFKLKEKKGQRTCQGKICN